PGARLAAAETALGHMQLFCQDQIKDQQDRLQQQNTKSHQAWQQVEEALEECANGGGLRLFGGKTNPRLLRASVDRLAAVARQRLAEEVTGAARHFYLALSGKLGERLREMNFCRQRLRHLQEYLESPIYNHDEEEMATTRAGELTVSHSPMPSTESFYDAI